MKSLYTFLFVCFLLVCIIFYQQPRHDIIRKVNDNKKKSQQEHGTSSATSIADQNKNTIPVEFPTAFQYHKPTKNEKFVTYLPHSGFHNQRIELENALLLAGYLNRTLLLPSVYLGNPAFPWLRFDKMYERLLLQTKNGLDYCSLLREGEPIPTECLNYSRWTAVPWTFFYDFTELLKKVRIVFRQDLSLEWLKSSLELQDQDIYLFKDNSPFDFRVYDLPESKTPLTRFINRIDLATLESIESRVIHFGSVFGTSRVLAQSTEHVELLKLIRREMIFKNPVLTDTAARIVDKLGGNSNFIGIHLRVGDGLFKVRATITIDDIFHDIVNEYTDLTLKEVLEYEDNRHDQDRKENLDYEIKQLREPAEKVQEKPLQVQHPSEAILKTRLGPSELLLNCQKGDGRNDRFAKTTIFLATDCPNPRNHPLLRKIFKTFPCTFVLADFKNELSQLAKVKVVKENVKLETYLIPMLDAIVASQGHTFFGTNASTFSTYIERQLHPIYTNQQIQV